MAQKQPKVQNTLTLIQTAEAVEQLINANLIPFVLSAPGIGKSSMFRAVAEKLNLKMIDVRAAGKESPDINGVPYPNEDRTKMTYLPFDQFPLANEDLPVNAEGNAYNGWLVFFDEAPNAAPDVQAALYQILLERMVGKEHIHPKVRFALAGNNMDNGCGVEVVSNALASRTCVLQVRSDFNSWKKMFADANVDSRIVSYLEWKPSNLNVFDGNLNSDGVTPFPCERTWTFCSQYLKSMGTDMALTPVTKQVLAGFIGTHVGFEFYNFLQTCLEAPKISEIIANPHGAPFDTKRIDIQWATMGYLAEHFTAENAEALTAYAKRANLELQYLLYRMISAKYPVVIGKLTAKSESHRQWASSLAALMRE